MEYKHQISHMLTIMYVYMIERVMGYEGLSFINYIVIIILSGMAYSM